MSAPEQTPNDLHFERFAAYLYLHKIQGRFISNLAEADPDILRLAHDFALRRIDETVPMPPLWLCQPRLYQEFDRDGYSGGIQFNFSRPITPYGRYQSTGVRVQAFHSGEPFIQPQEPFTTTQAEEIARRVDALAELAANATQVYIDPDLSIIANGGY